MLLMYLAVIPAEDYLLRDDYKSTERVMGLNYGF